MKNQIKPTLQHELPSNFCQEMFLLDKSLDHIQIIFTHKKGGIGFYESISKYETKPHGKPIDSVGTLRKMADKLELADVFFAKRNEQALKRSR